MAVPEGVGAGPSGVRGRVLLVGGTQETRAAPRRWLEDSGYAVWAVDRSEDWNLELVPSRPDVVVLDASQPPPGQLGSSTQRWESPDDVPVVVITKATDMTFTSPALPGRAYDYLERPLERTRLLTTMRNAVERRRLELRISHFESSGPPRPVSPALSSPPLRLDELERIAIENALEHTRGNLSAVGRQLGIGRTTLYRKIKKYGL